MGTTKLALNSKWSGNIPVPNQPRPDAQPKPAPQFAQTYTYDSIGNRTQFLTESGGEKTNALYESNALNQYTKLKRNEQDPAPPTHDPDGNLLDDDRNHYTWNAENRCVKVEGKDGSYTVENSYDYQGRKTTRRHSTPTSVKTTIYLYDGWNVLAEIEKHSTKVENGGDVAVREPQSPSVSPSPHLIVSPSCLKTHQRFYTWGRDLSGTLRGVGGVGGQLAITKKEQDHEDSTMFPCYDANGNISQMVSPKAEILAAYQYDAFGRIVDLAGEKAAENEWRFSTKPWDSETSAYYYGYRDYDPKNGRWTTRDPIWERGGVNLYGFVENNGVNGVDLLGNKYVPLKWTSPEYIFDNGGNRGFKGTLSPYFYHLETVDSSNPPGVSCEFSQQAGMPEFIVTFEVADVKMRDIQADGTGNTSPDGVDARWMTPAFYAFGKAHEEGHDADFKAAHDLAQEYFDEVIRIMKAIPNQTAQDSDTCVACLWREYYRQGGKNPTELLIVFNNLIGDLSTGRDFHQDGRGVHNNATNRMEWTIIKNDTYSPAITIEAYRSKFDRVK